MSFATRQSIYLVGNCLFPRMAKEYNGCYILLNRITSNCCILILGVYYNILQQQDTPFIFLDHGTFPQTTPNSREKKQVEQGAQTEPIEPETKTQAAPSGVQKLGQDCRKIRRIS